jgi:hypothetical protein
MCSDKSMTGEESMVLSHIQASGNEGMATLPITGLPLPSKSRYLDEAYQGEDGASSDGSRPLLEVVGAETAD